MALTYGAIEGEGLDEFRASVAKAQEALSIFNDMAQKARSSVLERKNYAHMEALRARMVLQSRQDNRSGLMLDLMRQILVSFAADPSRDLTRFQSNALSAAAFAINLPDQQPSLQLSTANRFCENGNSVLQMPGMCIVISPSDNWQYVFGTFQGTVPFEVPLYAVAPGAGPFVFPTNGVAVSMKDGMQPEASVALSKARMAQGLDFNPFTPEDPER